MKGDLQIADAVLHGPDFPLMVSITTTSRCNLRCVMCHHGIRNVKKQDFDMELVERFDDFFATASLITLTGLGEAFLSDSFWEVLRLGRETNDGTRPHVFSFNTNGTLLNEKNVDKILESRVKKMRVSIDSADPVMKKKIRGTDLKTIVDGTRRLVETRNQRGYRYPLVGIEMTLMKDTSHEVDAMIDLAVDLGVDFLEIWPLNVMNQKTAEDWTVEKNDWRFNYWEQMVSSLPNDTDRRMEREYLARAQAKGLAMITRLSGVPISNDLMAGISKSTGMEELYDAGNSEAASAEIPWRDRSIRCDLPWKQQRVTYEGDAFNCCWGRGAVGTLRENSASEIWHGEKQKAMREMLIEGVIPSFCATSPCPFIRGASEERTNDISKKQYFNFSPYGNGVSAEKSGWTKGDDWGLSSAGKRADLNFAKSQFLAEKSYMEFTLKSQEEGRFDLIVKVNGELRTRISLGGDDAGAAVHVRIDINEKDFAPAGIMEVSFEQPSRWPNLFGQPKSFLLHSAHVHGVQIAPSPELGSERAQRALDEADSLALL